MKDITWWEASLIRDVFLDKVSEIEEVIEHEETHGEYDYLLKRSYSILAQATRRISENDY